MSNHRFRRLEMEMIRRGVALRHARRAALELESHHRELLEQALARGETPGQARRTAHEGLGSDAVLVERWTQQRELQSWAYRWRAGYVLAPLCGFAAVFTAAVVALIAASSGFSAVLRHTRLSGPLTHDIDALATVLLLWVAPVAVAIGFGALAGRQHIALRWLSAGVVVLSIIAAQMNVRFVLTGGTLPGLIGAGIGVSGKNVPHELLHIVAMTALTLIPAAWLRYRAISRRTAPG